MTKDELIAELRRRGVNAYTYDMADRKKIRAVCWGPGDSRYHEVDYTLAAAQEEHDLLGLFALEALLAWLMDLPEDELRKHSWWEWSLRNKEWVLSL
jgi:hypothetical protein